MINPAELVDRPVALLRDIPELVVEMGGHEQRIFAYHSTELTKLRQQTTGTAIIPLTYDANNSLEITWHKVSFATAEVGETDGIVTVPVECLPMWDETNGIVSAVAKCQVDGIGQ